MANAPYRKNEDGTFTLCDGEDDCCPRVEVLPDGRFLLEDDDGMTVRITKKQAAALGVLAGELGKGDGT